eukprot:TRINITY_DN1403_c1_g1_i1.p1 TRINITY_DN1403_c1_g1~~TRINITY_DN1403_c1_g1_i1.p1  ORF type:complete len:1672 (+),score=277.91 TRINITY_DN1403_c1_g1_i1:210-5018(+)
MTGSLLSFTSYGFRIQVQNGIGYKPEHLNGWRIFTQDMFDYRVDGTVASPTGYTVEANLPQMPAHTISSSFGLFSAQLNTPEYTRLAVQVGALRPGERTLVTFRPFRVPAAFRANLRVTAPKGFVWQFTDPEFRYLAPYPTADPTKTVEEVSADLPGGVPVRSGNVMLWQTESNWDPFQFYGFQAYVMVPKRSPTDAPNVFTVEFGYDGTTLATRYAASSVPCALVMSLVNAQIDYITNVESKVNDLIFQLETATVIPPGGGLVITGPGGFGMPECNLQVAPHARGSTYQVNPLINKVKMLPTDVTCMFKPGANATEFHLIAGKSGIQPSLYRWKVSARNPSKPVPNPEDQTTICGFRYCWEFHSFKDINNRNSILDLSTHVPAFPINRIIVQAIFPPLTRAQQAATGRDDRPLYRNPLVFAFQLNAKALYAAHMLIRGPLGTIFREDCGEDVEVRPTDVFGAGQSLPPGYAEWPDGVKVVSCRGEGPNARIFLDPGITDGLLAENLYPIRVATLKNPLSQPIDNRWTLDFNGESSDPFQGYELWTFTRRSLITASTGMSTAVTGAAFLKVPVTITFRPRNTVKGKGMIIKVSAPPNFQFAHESLECKLKVQPVYIDAQGYADADPNTPPEPNYIGPPSLIWGDADVKCLVDAGTFRILTAEVLAASRELTGGRDYQITMFVRNPNIPVEMHPGNVWRLETFNSPGESGVLPTFRDASTLTGYPVYNKAAMWLFRNQDPATGKSFKNGLTEIPGLFFQMQLNTKIQPTNVITITAPPGFNFRNPPGEPNKCGGFTWEPASEAYLFLPNSNLTCNENVMKFVVDEPRDIPELRLMTFRVDSKNPAKTPHVMLNHWSLTFTDKAGTILATEAAPSWNVIPQLFNVQVMLVGAQKAEGSVSKMAISYIPVSDADELELAATAPAGYDFSGAGTESNGHEVIATSVEVIRVRAAMFSAVKVDIVITRFKLGNVGGPTNFNLITKLNNGDQIDEMLNFKGGYRLPGRVGVVGPSIRSMYNLDPNKYPVPSLWEVRMGEDALVQIPFTLTMTAYARDNLRIRAPPYQLLANGFMIVQSSSGEVVTSEVISASSGELVAKMSGLLFPNVQYEARINTITPKVPNPRDAMWSVEILDGGALPVNTNDGLTEGFRLAEKVDLIVRATRSPPMAEIDAQFIFDPKTTRPDTLILVAAPGFNFTMNCLVWGGEFSEIKSCEYIGNLAGRAAARLRTVKLSKVIDNVVIRIKTPAQTSAEPSWFIQALDQTTGFQLGWGEDTVGVVVRQMQGARVVYPGIPSISGEMAFRFMTNEKLDEGGKLRVGYPKSIEVNCAGAYLKKVALEGTVRCRNYPREGYFELQLTRPLPPGQQAFAVTSTCPSKVPDNEFYIIVMTSAGQVQDAAMSIQGMPIQHGLPVAGMPLIWGNSEPRRVTFLSIGFEVLGELPLKDPPLMHEVIVQLPDDFSQQITRAAHVEVMGDKLPYARQWLIVNDPRKLRLILDTTKTGKLGLGQYRFQFPIMVPARMPKYNVWELTICQVPLGADRGSNKTCEGPRDPRALVTFPLAGFRLGESHPSAIKYLATGAASSLQRPSSLLCLVFLVLLHSFLRAQQR